MTTPTSPLLPEPLKVVAWIPQHALYHLANRARKSVAVYPEKDNEGESALVLLSEAEAALNALRAEVAALRVDAERLDWMDKNPGRVKHSTGYRGAPDSWVWTDTSGYGHDAANLRAAINASREALQPGEEK